MNFFNLNLFYPKDSLLFPTRSPKNGKHICFYYLGENVNFFDIYSRLEIKPQYIRTYFSPIVLKPVRSYLSNDERSEVLEYKLKPVRDYLGKYNKVPKANFYYDANKVFNALDKRYKIHRYNSSNAIKIYTNFINILNGIDNNIYEKTLLYAVDLDQPLNSKLFMRRFFPIFYMLINFANKKIENLPFDKILLVTFRKDIKKFTLLYDKNYKNNNINKIRQILAKLQNEKLEQTDQKVEDTLVNISSTDSNISKNSNIPESVIKSALTTYINADSAITNKDVETHALNSNNDMLITKSIIYNVVGDIDKAQKITDKLYTLPAKKREQILQDLAPKILPKHDAKSITNNIVLNTYNIPRVLDNLTPEHIFEKRKIDFRVDLKNDILNAFKTLEEKDIPLKITGMKIKEIQTGPSEINQTIKDRYLVDLKDKDGNIHNVYVDIPHLTDNGTFMINGQNKVLTYQIIRFPLFFRSKYTARFESAYAVITINSKQLQKGLPYFILHMGNYKFPIIMYLAYKYGLKEAMKMFNVTYTLS